MERLAFGFSYSHQYVNILGTSNKKYRVELYQTLDEYNAGKKLKTAQV